MAAPVVVRWAVRHGLVRVALQRAAKKGEPQAVLMIDRSSRENPFPLYDRIRSRGLISRGGLTYVAASREAASAVLRSDVFRVGLNFAAVPWYMRGVLTRGSDGRIVGPVDPPSLLAVNPPEHSRYRRQVAKVFTPRAIAALEPRVQQIAEGLLDDLELEAKRAVDSESQDVVDLVSSYASLLPVTVIAEILGVPVEMRDQFLKWGNAAAPTLDIGLSYREYRDCERGIRALNEWMYAHIERLRRNPGDDLLSKLITVEDDGVRMTDLELMATAGLLLAAGFETTVNLIGSGAQLLLTHPDQLQVLREDPSVWGNAIDEILRYESPVQNTARYAAVDTEICGLPIPKSGFVQVLIGAANRDPEAFADPGRFDVRRANARDHLAFSAGVHYCIGAALARAEGRIGLRALFERYPELATAGPATRRPTRTLRGYETLPVRLGTVYGVASGRSAG
jgi:cytochrome P450